MTGSASLAGLAGALAVAGALLLGRELVRRDRPPERPALVRLVRGRAAAVRRASLAGVAGLTLLAVTGWPVLALAGAAAVAFVPAMAAVRSARRQILVLEGLEQWVRRLADLLSAGRGLEDALEVSARTAPASVAGPIAGLARCLVLRTGTRDALLSFADEIDDPAADRIAAALIIATGQRGGALAGVLTALADMLARDVAARRQIEADRAEHRTAIRWIIGFVGAFTVFAIVNRSYSAPFGTAAGEAVLALVTLLYAAGLAWLNRLSVLANPGRFLRREDL